MRMIWPRVREGASNRGRRGLGGSSEDLAPHNPRGIAYEQGVEEEKEKEGLMRGRGE